MGRMMPRGLARDPIYDIPEARGEQAGQLRGPGRTVSLRERLLLTQPVWLQLSANAAAALHVLQREPPGTFLVRKSNTRQCKALCVRLPEASGPSFVSSHDIRESPEAVSLEGSELSFPDLIQLISAYCHSRDILLLPLQLPRAIRRATTRKELEAISHLGMEFWNSSLNSKAQRGLTAPSAEAPPIPRLKPRSPEELDQGTGGALCFFNPLFPGDLGPAKREKFKRSFKVRVSTETSSPLSPPAVPPPPVPLPPGGPPAQTQTVPPRRPLRRESSGGYRVPGSAGPTTPPLPSLPCLREVDSGSPSSSEEEGCQPGTPASSPRPGRRRRLLRSMSDAFCSLLAPERQVARAVVELAQDRQTVTGQLVQDLLTQVRAGPEPQELQKVREVLSQAQTLLVAELAQEKLLAEERLELVIEKSLHRSVLKPLRPVLLARLRLRFAKDGSLGRLAQGLRLARAQGPAAFGSCLSLPSPSEMERIRQKLLKLLRGYSPTAKVTRLLQACKLLYRALRSWAGESAGADDFLPLLSAVLAQCDLPELLPEAEYMAELLEPSLLTGEGGYCLTSLAASLTLLGSLGQAGSQPISPSQELQRSLSLWEQRRLPPTRNFKHLLRVAYQDPVNGCTSKTLALPPGSSAATLCLLCATKFWVSRPEAFALFLHDEKGSRRLAPDTLPHDLSGPGYLIYRQVEEAPKADNGRPGTTEEVPRAGGAAAGLKPESQSPEGGGGRVGETEAGEDEGPGGGETEAGRGQGVPRVHEE
ncbi:ras and Rab interactor 1 isoform X2 [Phascolarctos cinereus]|uniref:Ras and Rab interactor 1 isoform X2 n=1 Tax=Phascolarctos cinereus TaxID=38626 RepID=A0A6P5IPK6_PHACI|nr:ras and Rab interactor 1 isoform X2 [Phascolarctos cinereus]